MSIMNYIFASGRVVSINAEEMMWLNRAVSAEFTPVQLENTFFMRFSRHDEELAKQRAYNDQQISKVRLFGTKTEEKDPHGKDAHEKGSKLDAGKPFPFLVLSSFAPAILEVVNVGTYGANKYTRDGWKTVPDGVQRYQEASERHNLEMMKGGILCQNPKDGNLYHMAQKIWNDLAAFTLALKEFEELQSKEQPQAVAQAAQG